MRVLIVSDLHANPDALAVLPNADAVVCGGDLVDFGPDPAATIQWCLDRRATVVTGNHDYALAHDADCGVKGAMRAASVESRAVHRRLLDAAQVDYLRALPTLVSVALGPIACAVTHAVPDDVYRYAKLRLAGGLLRERVPAADVYVLGHTHVQDSLAVDGKVLVNPGSVGVSSEGGQAHYALWEDGSLSLCSASYDVEAALAKLARLGLSADVFERLSQALRYGRKRAPGDLEG